jgi:hypothetical protein
MKKRESGYMINVYLLREDANGRTFGRTLAFGTITTHEYMVHAVDNCGIDLFVDNIDLLVR